MLTGFIVLVVVYLGPLDAYVSYFESKANADSMPIQCVSTYYISQNRKGCVKDQSNFDVHLSTSGQHYLRN